MKLPSLLLLHLTKYLNLEHPNSLSLGSPKSGVWGKGLPAGNSETGVEGPRKGALPAGLCYGSLAAAKMCQTTSLWIRGEAFTCLCHSSRIALQRVTFLTCGISPVWAPTLPQHQRSRGQELPGCTLRKVVKACAEMNMRISGGRYGGLEEATKADVEPRILEPCWALHGNLQARRTHKAQLIQEGFAETKSLNCFFGPLEVCMSYGMYPSIREENAFLLWREKKVTVEGEWGKTLFNSSCNPGNVGFRRGRMEFEDLEIDPLRLFLTTYQSSSWVYTSTFKSPKAQMEKFTFKRRSHLSIIPVLGRAEELGWPIPAVRLRGMKLPSMISGFFLHSSTHFCSVFFVGSSLASPIQLCDLRVPSFVLFSP